MSALTYLTLTRLKNGIRDLLRKPARLIYVVFLLALLVFAVQGSGSTYPPESYRDLREVVAMATALFLFIFLLTVWNGFSKGGTIFSLSDVNLLFPSPIHRTRTLFYGLLRQISTALLLGIFLFYQYGWLHNLYGITMASMVALFLCYTAAVFLGQVTAMTIYTFTSSHEGAQKLLKGLIILCLQDTFPVEALKQAPYILRPDSLDNETREIFRKTLCNPRITYSAKDDYAVMAMVERGLGISILPELLLKRTPYRLAKRELSPPATRQIGVACKNPQALPPAARQFLHHIKQAAPL